VKCVGFAQAEGLIVRSLMGDRIAICPPLVISEAEIHEMFDRLTRALDRTAEWIAKEGLVAA
jgi:4-aminobutyrate--pyruvate transaminase